MFKKVYLVIVCSFLILACNKPTRKETTNEVTSSSSESNSISNHTPIIWTGIYEGTFNCEGCDNTKATITLRPNNTYCIFR